MVSCRFSPTNQSIDLMIFFLNIEDPRYTKVHGTQTPNYGGKLGVHGLAMAASECHGVSKTLGRRMPFEKGHSNLVVELFWKL